MNMPDNPSKTIQQYFNIEGQFVIPEFQRGYKWGVPNPVDDRCAVKILMKSLMSEFERLGGNEMNKKEYFLQGVTAYKKGRDVYLIDGQQRTITLFILLNELLADKSLLLTNNKSDIKLKYSVRKESHRYLQKMAGLHNEIVDESSQDIFYFKKARDTIQSFLPTSEIDRDALRDFILKHVKVYFMLIAPEQSIKSFRMLNGQKAFMKSEELIKAEILSKATKVYHFSICSSADNNQSVPKWESTLLRSRYAREWDRWLYWWHRKDVSDFYETKRNPMGLLLEYFYLKNIDDKERRESVWSNRQHTNSIFNSFKHRFLASPKDAKNNFKAIRDLQKLFEDLFNNFETYNYLGIIFKIGLDRQQIQSALLHFLALEKKDIKYKIKEYAKWALAGATHLQIITVANPENASDSKEDKACKIVLALGERDVYNVYNSYALRQLLRLNVQMDTELRRKFDFAIYGSKSLEHIHPKSKVVTNENEDEVAKDNEKGGAPELTPRFLDFREETLICEHSIGNLVLLSSPDNSSFNDRPFLEKKVKFFSPMKNMKYSMSLLHSLRVFSNAKWNIEEIRNNQDEFCNELKEYYDIK